MVMYQALPVLPFLIDASVLHALFARS